jgi:thioredoxin 1
MSIISFSNENFDAEVLNSEKPVLIDFWASWCGPCKMQAPIFDAVAEENPDVVFGKINIDEEQELATKYSVMSIPTLILFKSGQPVEKLVGLQSEDEIQEILDENK